MEASKNVSKVVVVVVVVIWRALLLVNPSLLYFSVGFMLFQGFFASNCFYKKVKVDFVILPIVCIVLRKRSVMNACQTISYDARRGKMSNLGHCSKKNCSKKLCSKT
jgi:hypothetical protein